ncbi:MAG: methyltransferase domain-containing protein [Cuspidothrix sp.]
MRSNPDHTKTMAVYLLCFSGLADIVEIELNNNHVKGNLLAKYHLRDHDLIIWQCQNADIIKLKKLRTVEDIFYAFNIKPFQLEKLGDFKKKCNFDINLFRKVIFESINLKNILYGHQSKKKSVSYISFVKQDIDHGVARKAVARHLNQIFATAFPKWKCNDPADMECWGFWIKDQLFVGIRITPPSFRARTYKDEERQGSLRPTIAAAIAVLSNPNPSDKLVDPMCGSGTLLIERGFLASYTSLSGYDIDPNATRLAIANIANAGIKHIDIKTEDATDLPVENGRFNCLICNLPFGKIYGDRNTNLELYYRCLKEWSRVIELGGRAIVLTSDTESFRQAQKKLSSSWKIQKNFRFKVLGIWANCFVLCRI